MKPWDLRPIEQRTLLNPAFLAVLIAETARGHLDEGAEPLPFALTFLAVPLVVHEPTREALPTIATSSDLYVRLAATAPTGARTYPSASR